MCYIKCKHSNCCSLLNNKYFSPITSISLLFKSQKILFKTEHWFQIYSNQKEINYISHSNIRASVETRPPKLHNLLQFSPPLPSLTFYGPRPRTSRVSVIHWSLVYLLKLIQIDTIKRTCFVSIDFHRLVKPFHINRLIFYRCYWLYRFVSDDWFLSIGHAGA